MWETLSAVIDNGNPKGFRKDENWISRKITRKISQSFWEWIFSIEQCNGKIKQQLETKHVRKYIKVVYNLGLLGHFAHCEYLVH